MSKVYRYLPPAIVLLAPLGASQAFCYPTPEVHLVAGASFTAEIADVDGDGHPDVVAGSGQSSGAVHVLINDGQGSFSPGAVVPVGTGVLDVLDYDADGDGQIDLATVEFDDQVAILMGDGAGGFTPGPVLGGGTYPYALASADMNEDGIADLLSANHFSDDVSVWLGQPLGGYSPAAAHPAGAGCNGIAILDFNQDGNLDCILSNRHDDDAWLLTGDGLGGLAKAQVLSTGDGPIGIATGDLDLDGLRDVVVANHLDDTVSVFGGTGSFDLRTVGTLFAGDQPEAPALADLDGDEVLDLAVENSLSDGLSLYRGLGDGTFAPEVGLSAGDRPHGLDAADLNHDHKADLVTAHLESQDVTVHVSACPAIAAVTPTAAHEPQVITVLGEDLHHVTAASVAGAPAAIVAQSESALDLQIQPHDPGFFALELEAFDATFPEDVELWPSLLASTTGAGGVLEAEIDLGAPGIWSLAAGAGSSSMPLVLPGIAYGLLIDLSQPWVVLAEGVLATAEPGTVALPVPPSLSGSQWCLQGWGACWPWPVCAPSFTNAVELTIP